MKYSQALVFSFLLAITKVSAQSIVLGEACRFSIISEGKLSLSPLGTTIKGDVDAPVNGMTGMFQVAGDDDVDVYYSGVEDSPSALALRDIQLAFDSTFSSTGKAVSPNLGGETFTPGIYESHGDTTLASGQTVTFEGSSDGDFIILVRGDLTITTDSTAVFENATAKNVYWIVSGVVTLNSPFYGTIMSRNSINFLDGSSLIGRAYSKSFIKFSPGTSISLPDVNCTCTIEGSASGLCNDTSLGLLNLSRYERALAAVTTTSTSSVISQGNAGGLLLGSHALSFTLLSMTGISTVPDSNIVGDIGVSPVSYGAITGFKLGDGMTSSQISSGNRAFGPEFTRTDSGVAEMQVAYLSGRSQVNPDFEELSKGELAGLTLGPGLYTWSTDVNLEANQTVTLNGKCGDIFVLQVAGTMTTQANSNVVLVGGLTAATVYWILATSLDTGANSFFSGTVLSLTTVVVGTNSLFSGRIFSQTSITLHMAGISPPTIGSGPVVIPGVCSLQKKTTTQVKSKRSSGLKVSRRIY